MEITVNKECDNYMKQMFKTCENAYKIFYSIIFLEIVSFDDLLIDFSFVLWQVLSCYTF